MPETHLCVVRETEGSVLTSFPVSMQPPHSPEVSKTSPYVENFHDCPTPQQDAAHTLLTWLHWFWKVLDKTGLLKLYGV